MKAPLKKKSLSNSSGTKNILSKPVKKLSGFLPKIRSRHPSHDVLRGRLPRMPFRSVIRFGSTTEVPGVQVEINTPQAIRNSASKFLMKDCFKAAEVKTAEFWKVREVREQLDGWEVFPLVAKINFGSRGRGMKKIDTLEELRTFLNQADLSGYYFERFHNYNREYRLHVHAGGYFYACRKMVKSDTPEDQRWFRNDSNSVWILEENEQFDKPVNWDQIVEESVKALQAVGLDIGACDVRVQSAKDKKGNPRQDVDFIVVEINSAPSFGEVTAEKYREVLPQILRRKHEQL